MVRYPCEPCRWDVHSVVHVYAVLHEKRLESELWKLNWQPHVIELGASDFSRQCSTTWAMATEWQPALTILNFTQSVTISCKTISVQWTEHDTLLVTCLTASMAYSIWWMRPCMGREGRPDHWHRHGRHVSDKAGVCVHRSSPGGSRWIRHCRTDCGTVGQGSVARACEKYIGLVHIN